MKLGEFIGKIAFWSGLSQKELAEKMDITAPNLNEIVRGRRSVSVKTAKKLEGIFGIPAAVWAVYQSMEDIREYEEEEEV